MDSNFALLTIADTLISSMVCLAAGFYCMKSYLSKRSHPSDSLFEYPHNLIFHTILALFAFSFAWGPLGALFGWENMVSNETSCLTYVVANVLTGLHYLFCWLILVWNTHRMSVLHYDLYRHNEKYLKSFRIMSFVIPGITGLLCLLLRQSRSPDLSKHEIRCGLTLEYKLYTTFPLIFFGISVGLYYCISILRWFFQSGQIDHHRVFQRSMRTSYDSLTPKNPILRQRWFPFKIVLLYFTFIFPAFFAFLIPVLFHNAIIALVSIIINGIAGIIIVLIFSSLLEDNSNDTSWSAHCFDFLVQRLRQGSVAFSEQRYDPSLDNNGDGEVTENDSLISHQQPGVVVDISSEIEQEAH